MHSQAQACFVQLLPIFSTNPKIQHITMFTYFVNIVHIVLILKIILFSYNSHFWWDFPWSNVVSMMHFQHEIVLLLLSWLLNKAKSIYDIIATKQWILVCKFEMTKQGSSISLFPASLYKFTPQNYSFAASDIIHVLRILSRIHHRAARYEVEITKHRIV